MKLPLSWLAEFVEIPKSESVSSIAEHFVSVGFEVESIENAADNIKGPLVIGTVIAIEELKDHKKPIRYVELDCAEKEHRFVICGATNFLVGDKVVVALPGALLPGDFAIAARETYGKTSNGMICSSRELGLSEDHSGIMVVNDSLLKNGDDAVKVLVIDDPVIDIAVNPDRGYALSIRGAARELASALKVPFKDPADSTLPANLKVQGKSKAIEVVIDESTGADLIFLRTLENVNTNNPSPIWMQRRIQKCGMRSISVAVDITNYVMLELGQPLHAFDADKLSGRIHVQSAGKFSKIKTLDGVERNLSKSDLLIADDKNPLAIAGTMGGLESEVTSDTKRITIEAAHFSALAVAKNSRNHILSSEASRRFERGVDPALAEVASARAALLLIELTGALYVGVQSAGGMPKISAITLAPANISTLIGYEYSYSQVSAALESVGCLVNQSGKSKSWEITPPSWRPDLQNTADLSEEVARRYGYQLIPSLLPPVRINGESGLNLPQKRKRAIAIKLANLGLTEVQTYPFVSAEIMKLLGFTGDRAKTFRIANPMSDETPFLRTHLTPGLLLTAQRNINRGAKSIAIFELGSIFRNLTELKSQATIRTDKRPTGSVISEIYNSVPKQPLHAGGILGGKIESAGWWGKGRAAAWSDAVDMAATLLDEMGATYKVSNTELAPWHPGRCAEFQIDGKPVAHAGELHPRIISELGLPERTSAFVVVLDAVPFREQIVAPKVWTMPAAIQDISLIVADTISSADVSAALKEGAGDLLESITLFDRYDQVGEGKISLAFTLVFRAEDRTLTAEEVSLLRESAGNAAVKACGATIRTA